MLMKDNKKKLATIIISRVGKGQEKMREAPMKDGAEQEMDEKSIAADEVFDALERKDRAAFIEAMQSLVHMCASSSEEPESSEDSESESEE